MSPFLGALAQSVEQLAFNQLVVRSSRTRPTIFPWLQCVDNSRPRHYLYFDFALPPARIHTASLFLPCLLLIDRLRLL